MLRRVPAPPEPPHELAQPGWGPSRRRRRRQHPLAAGPGRAPLRLPLGSAGMRTAEVSLEKRSAGDPGAFTPDCGSAGPRAGQPPGGTGRGRAGGGYGVASVESLVISAISLCIKLRKTKCTGKCPSHLRPARQSRPRGGRCSLPAHTRPLAGAPGARRRRPCLAQVALVWGKMRGNENAPLKRVFKIKNKSLSVCRNAMEAGPAASTGAEAPRVDVDADADAGARVAGHRRSAWPRPRGGDGAGNAAAERGECSRRLTNVS